MQKTIYGYVRVSTKEQCEDRQLLALREFPVAESNIYMDKLSGKDFNRPCYQRLLRRLRPGDTLVVKSIDRAAIMRKFWTSGALSPRPNRPTLWCWICRCWTPGRPAGT